MRVELKVEGGLAYLPGLKQPITVDSDKLSKSDADKLKKLVDAAEFFDLPQTINKPARGAADYQRYTITVEAGKRHHAVQAVDPVDSTALLDLIDYVRDVAAKQK
jgi:emfourin